MERFLAIVRLPGVPPERVRGVLQLMAEEALATGLHPVETFFDAERRVAYTHFTASRAADVRAVHERAGLPDPEVVPVDHIFTELLAEPRRERYA